MTIKDIVTSTSPSLSRSFTGDLELADEPVAVSVVFAEGSVRLLLGGDTVGAWSRSEVQFVPAESGYELVAEGDSLSFVPHDRDAFAAFVRSKPTEEPGPTFEPMKNRQVADPDAASAFETEVMPAGLQEDDQPGFNAGLEPEFAALEKSPQSLLDLDDEPDEFFAAGLNGPPSATTAPTFRSPLFGTEPPRDEAEHVDTAASPEEAVAKPADTESRDEAAIAVEDDEPTPTFRLDPPKEEASASNGHGYPWSKEPVNGHDSALDDVPGLPVPSDPIQTPREPTRPHEPALRLPPEPALPPDDQLNTPPYEEPEWTDDPSAIPASVVPELAPSPAYPEYVSDEPDSLDVPDSLVVPDSLDAPGAVDAPEAVDVPETEDGSTGGFLGRFRARASRPKGLDVDEQEQDLRVDEEASLTEDDTPKPIDDAENLRQWGLVAAGGLVITVVAVTVIWGLVSILGGDGDPVEQEAPAATVATAPPETAPPPEPTTPTVVPTSASPENIAAAQAFVSDWNSLASQYANQLSITADSLPISVAPEPTIHLNYQENGILSLSMAPRGNGNDRDILLAMGLAIAWADPDVSPEGRKSLLAELGVDVDDPVLSDMGGEVSRSGITYRTTVDEAILTFEVNPTG